MIILMHVFDLKAWAETWNSWWTSNLSNAILRLFRQLYYMTEGDGETISIVRDRVGRLE